MAKNNTWMVHISMFFSQTIGVINWNLTRQCYYIKLSMKMLMADFHETEKVMERWNICVCFFLDQCKDFTGFPIRSVFNNLQLIIFSIYIVTFCYPPLSWYMLFVQWPKKNCFLISANLHCRNLVYCKFMVSWIHKKKHLL